MSFLDDLDNNIKRAEKCLAQAEHAREQGWTTAYYFSISSVDNILKTVKHCVRCAKQKQAKLEKGKKFKCSGTCVKGLGFEKFSEINKSMQRELDRRHYGKTT